MPGFTVLAPAPYLVQKRLGIQLVPGVVWLPICVELAILIEALDIQIIQAKAPQDLTVTAVLDLLGQHASHLLFIQQMVGAVETAIGTAQGIDAQIDVAMLASRRGENGDQDGCLARDVSVGMCSVAPT